MKLTKEQERHFAQKGYLVLRRFVEPEQCGTILDIAKAHLKHKVPPIETELEYAGKSKEERETISGGEFKQQEESVTVRRLRQVYHRDIIFKQWMESRKIRPILEQVLGEEPRLTLAHHNSIMTKMPLSSTETSWHQDIRYWHFDNDNLVSIWLALDEENEKNGVLEFIPGSHKMDFTPDQFGEKEYFISGVEKNQALINSSEQTELGQGDVVLFHSKLLHRANKNSTESPKISFVYTVRGESNHPTPQTRSSEFPEIKWRYTD
ncbi:MAG: phytanoyl-CoA dioxygenase family protein [Campylobacterota bacterium]|nr:phytanoyl-CoA dioxygenase family protein [Campylobacterota bacterium]